MILRGKLLLYNITHRYTNRVRCLNSKIYHGPNAPRTVKKIMSDTINSLTCQGRRKSIGSSSSTSSSAGRVRAFALMRRRTLSGKPRERVACAAPPREVGFFVLDAGLGCIAGCFTGDGRGYKNTKKGNELLAPACPGQPLLGGKGSDAPCPCLPRPPRAPTCLSPCSLSHHGYTNTHD